PEFDTVRVPVPCPCPKSRSPVAVIEHHTPPSASGHGHASGEKGGPIWGTRPSQPSGFLCGKRLAPEAAHGDVQAAHAAPFRRPTGPRRVGFGAAHRGESSF